MNKNKIEERYKWEKISVAYVTDIFFRIVYYNGAGKKKIKKVYPFLKNGDAHRNNLIRRF